MLLLKDIKFSKINNNKFMHQESFSKYLHNYAPHGSPLNEHIKNK